MAKSILGSVVEGFVNNDTREQFINKVHTDSGISKDKLNEVYSQGLKFAMKTGKHTTTTAKANVYTYVNSKLTEQSDGWKDSGTDDLEYAFEKTFKGVISILNNDEYDNAFKMFTDTFAEIDDENSNRYGADVFVSKDKSVLRFANGRWLLNTTAILPVLKKIVRSVKGIPDSSGVNEEGGMNRHERTADRLKRGAKAMFDKAVQRGLSSKDLYRQARLADKMGEPQTDALFMAGDMLAKHEKRMFGENTDSDLSADDGRKYALWDRQDKKWVSKPVSKKSLNRLRSRRDKLDNEHGSYRYTVKEV